MKIKQVITGVMVGVVLLFIPVMGVHASDKEEYITITVQASDDNEGLTYALDNDDPSSFGPENTFTIPAETFHIIYVKDTAGNITSQVYEPEPTKPEAVENDNIYRESVSSSSADYVEKSSSSDSTNYVDSSLYRDDVVVTGGYDGQTIDIDLELGKSKDGDKKAYEIKQDAPAEQGEGTVYSKTFLDGTDSSEQVFYSVTTAEGNIFYLLIDQGQENNNVYLLNQVSNQDLKALVGDSNEVSQDNEGDSLLKVLSGAGSEENNVNNSKPTTNGGTNWSAIIVLPIMVVGGGFYYYNKIYKKKKEQEIDAMEAPDMDQFAASNIEEDEEFDFEYGEDDKEQYINELIREDEAEYAAAIENEIENIRQDNKEELNKTEMDKQEEDGEIISSERDIFSEEDIFSDSGLNYEYDPELDGEEVVSNGL